MFSARKLTPEAEGHIRHEAERGMSLKVEVQLLLTLNTDHLRLQGGKKRMVVFVGPFVVVAQLDLRTTD